MLLYLNQHFKTEEKLMIDANYPDVDEHILQHKYFIKKINEFALESEYNNTQLLEKLLHFIKKWG